MISDLSWENERFSPLCYHHWDNSLQAFSRKKNEKGKLGWIAYTISSQDD